MRAHINNDVSAGHNDKLFAGYGAVNTKRAHI